MMEEAPHNDVPLPPHVIIHAGMTKTGSTALQNLLSRHHEALLAQGVLFPRSLLTRKDLTNTHRTSGHWDIFRQIADADLSWFRAEVEGHRDRAHTLILSAEGIFHNASDANLEGLAALLTNSRLTLVVSVRSQASWAQSRYYESVVKGFFRETATYDEFLLALAQSGELDYFARIRRLEEHLRPAEVVVWDHDHLQESGGFVAGFLKQFNIDLPPDVADAESNISKPIPEAIEAHRRLNNIAAALAPGDYRTWCADMRTLAERSRREMSLRYGYTTAAVEIKKQVLELIGPSNELLSEGYLGGQPFGPTARWLKERVVVPDEQKVGELQEAGINLLTSQISRASRREQMVREDIAREKALRVLAEQSERVLVTVTDIAKEGEALGLAKQKLLSLVQQNEALLAYSNRLYAEYQATLNSRSWRATAFYRSLGSLAKRWLSGMPIKSERLLARPDALGISSSKGIYNAPQPPDPRPAELRCAPIGLAGDYEVDVCIVTTCRFPGGNASSTLDEVRTFRAAGLSVLVVHVPITASMTIADRYAGIIDSIAHFQDVASVRCRVLIARSPRVIMSDSFIRLASHIDADRAVFVINNSAFRPDGEPIFSWDEIKARIDSLPWLRKDVHPLGPAIRREALSHGYFELADEDWPPTFDVETLPFRPRLAMVEPYVIGRHGRDGAEKWLQDPERLRSAYPAGDRYQVRVLGGASKAETILGTLPDNWTVYPFGSLPVSKYLAKLDVFVYFPHSDLNEAFGRTIMEAMFSGLPCVLPPRFAETFGDFAFYCEAEDVAAVIERLAADHESRVRYVTIVRSEALKRFESQSLFRRLPELLGDNTSGQPQDLNPSLLAYKKWVERGIDFALVPDCESKAPRLRMAQYETVVSC